MTINEITLGTLLPAVFENETVPASDIWKRELVLRRGRNYMVEAASGTGKSSLCSFIYGARRDYSGRILFDGKDTSAFSISYWQELRRKVIAYLPQELSLFPELTALENIRLKNRLTNHFEESRIEDMMSALGIDARAHFPVGKMSVGQQQRVALLRSICQPFSFLILDEPVSHLDESNNQVAASIVEEEARRQGAAIIATSVGNKIHISDCELLRL